jgi:outer membrane protein TolC
VLAKNQKLNLANENQIITEEFARKSAIRRTLGEGTLLEQLTANVQRTQAQNAWEIATNELHIACNELELLLGFHRDAMRDELILTDSVVHRPHSFTLEQLYQMAAVSNTQITASSTKRDIASTGYSLAWSSLLPSFSASYFRQTRDGVSGLYGVSFGVSLPLWFLFDQRGQIQTASATFSIAEYELQFTQNSVVVAVKTAFYDKLNNERQLQLYETEILPQTAEILRAAKASFDAGEITYLEFLQARQTVVLSKANYIDVLYGYNVAVAKLEQTVGKTLE